MRDNHINVNVPQEAPAAALIHAEIERVGPISFERFMEVALYAPGSGYYTRGRDPFGAAGDFYTAEQIQPVFGTLIAQFMRTLRVKMGFPEGFCVVEPGAGRGEMAPGLAEFNYTPIDVAGGGWPPQITGVVFANEFFDALPVRVAVRRGGTFREVLVASDGERFRFIDGAACDGAALEYVNRYYAEAPDGAVIEIHLRALEWLKRIAEALTGWLVVIDYGYTSREFARFEAGTLMSYRRHRASSDVLSGAGDRDITAHLPFTVFEDRLQRLGFVSERFETLASFLLEAGAADQFAAALEADTPQESLRRRMQLKTLLYGMGETFRVLVAKAATK